MIELEVQFQIVIASVVFGMVVTNLYTCVDILLRKSRVLRSLIEFVFFTVASSGYYLLIYKINKGILSVYMPVCLLLGWYLHMKFYDKYFSYFYKYIFSKFHSIIDLQRSRWCRLWKELKVKKTKEVESTE